MVRKNTCEPKESREKTRREKMIEELRRHWMNTRALSLYFECPEKLIAEDLIHIRRSVLPQEKLINKPARCLNCGFLFKDREKTRKPSKCPICCSERIMADVFMVVRNK